MIKIKSWKYDDMTSKMTRFGDTIFNLNPERDSDNFGMVKVDKDGYVHENSRVEILKETEKAYQLRIADSWTEWMPKSAVVIG